MTIGKAGLAAAVLALAVSGCGSDNSRTENTDFARQTAQGVISLLPLPRKEASTPSAPPLSAEALAVSALESNKGPLLFAVVESQKNNAILGMIGENGGMRTYATPGSQALILRNGVLAASRGLGHDMISADVAASSALIRGRQAGTARKVLRYLDGVGLERPLPLTCTITPRDETSYPFAGQTWSGQQIAEHCEGSGAKIDNSYVVDAGGTILSSRQWISPELGYVTIQTLRR